MTNKKLIYSVLSHSVNETESCGMLLASQLKIGDFVALYGDLGAGKTAFIRGLCRVLVPTAEISSPTYSVVNEYEGTDMTVYHMDAYRISCEDDLESIGFYDYQNAVIACEWCENIPFALPKKYYSVTINGSGDSERKIVIEKVRNE